MGFFSKLFGKESKETKLLSARIVTDENYRYFISFYEYHRQVHAPEYVRLILYYYGKILSTFDLSSQQMSESGFILQQLVETLLFKGIRKDSHIMRDADVEDVAKLVSAPPVNVPREIVATLLFDDSGRRYVATHLPKSIYAQHMVFSVAALIQATLAKLDQQWVAVLNDSLSNMNKAYDSGQRYSNVASVAAEAYLGATRNRSKQLLQSEGEVFPEPPLLIKKAS